MTIGGVARCYLRAHRNAVLSTISKKLDGYPFGSVVPCVLDHCARPVILISGLAEHTKNIDADPRVSLLFQDAASGAQTSARLTLIGDAKRAHGDLDALQARYLSYYSDAERLIALGDFAFYRIEPLQLRFIAGFGAIHWISAIDFMPPANTMADCECDIITHMNTDHAHNLRDYCLRYKQMTVGSAVMVGIDCDGFDVRADNELLRFDFAQPATDASQARENLVAIARQARAP